MRAGWNPTLRNAIWAADPLYTEIVEAITVTTEDRKDLKSDWNGADSLTGFTLLEDGGVTLTPSSTLTMDESNTDDADLTNLGPGAAISAVFVQWDSSVPHDLQLRNAVIRVDPDISGDGREVIDWIAKLFVVESVPVAGVDEQVALLVHPGHGVTQRSDDQR